MTYNHDAWPPPTREESSQANSGSHPLCLGREVEILAGPDKGRFGVISGHNLERDVKVDVIQDGRLHHFRWFSADELKPTM